MGWGGPGCKQISAVKEAERGQQGGLRAQPLLATMGQLRAAQPAATTSLHINNSITVYYNWSRDPSRDRAFSMKELQGRTSN